MTRKLAVAALLLAPALAGARPKPTPLAPLEVPMSRVRPPPQAEPTYLPVDRSRMSALGAFHLLEREDGLLPAPRMKAIARQDSGYRVGQGLLVYALSDQGLLEVVGSGTVVGSQPISAGRARLVLEVRLQGLRLVTFGGETGNTGIHRAEWATGWSPQERRYFTYPGNLLGLDFLAYQKLSEGKIWVGMTRDQARVVMGAPEKVESHRTPWGMRSLWKYPRTYQDWVGLVFIGDQLAFWEESWSDRVADAERWDWQKRPTKNPWVGRESLF